MKKGKRCPECITSLKAFRTRAHVSLCRLGVEMKKSMFPFPLFCFFCQVLENFVTLRRHCSRTASNLRYPCFSFFTCPCAFVVDPPPSSFFFCPLSSATFCRERGPSPRLRAHNPVKTIHTYKWRVYLLLARGPLYRAGKLKLYEVSCVWYRS